MSYGLEVFEKRTELGLTVQEVSKKTGIPVGNIRAIEDGGIPNLTQRLQLSKFLGLDKDVVNEV